LGGKPGIILGKRHVGTEASAAAESVDLRKKIGGDGLGGNVVALRRRQRFGNRRLDLVRRYFVFHANRISDLCAALEAEPPFGREEGRNGGDVIESHRNFKAAAARVEGRKLFGAKTDNWNPSGLERF
jgi:hypothetical protein